MLQLKLVLVPTCRKEGMCNKICQNGLYLCLGTREGTEFRLVCDLYLEKATLLLVRRALHQEVVVSVWETFYEGIPYIITDEQVGEARRLAIEP